MKVAPARCTPWSSLVVIAIIAMLIEILLPGGFTLIELLVVIAIIALLIGILLPKVSH